MDSYKKWVRENKDYLHSLESLANGLTWILPERFSSSEIGPEAVTAIVGIITAINEHIIDGAPTSKMHACSPKPLFPYSLCISALKDIETLVEVVAQHYCGDDKKWNFIAVTEATKVLLRLSLFHNSGYKMLIRGEETSNDVMNVDASTSQHWGDGFPNPGYRNSHFSRNINGHSPSNIEGRALNALNRFGENARVCSADPVWLRRLQHQQAIMEPPIPADCMAERPSLSRIFSEKGGRGVSFVTSEFLFIARPLFYVLLIRKYGVKSWIPWLLSLAVDFIEMGIQKYATSEGSSTTDHHFHLSISEKDEIRRRKILCALYLMRDPFFSKYTRGRLEKTEKFLEPIPIIGPLVAKITELVVGAQTRYTYMSGS